MCLLVGLSAAVAFQSFGLGLAAAITLILFAEYWALMNPRIRGYFSRILAGKLFKTKFGRAVTNKLERNPAAIFMGGCYILLLGITAVMLTASLGLVDAAKAMESVNLVASHIFFLILLAVAAQILWNTYVSRKALGRRSSRP